MELKFTLSLRSGFLSLNSNRTFMELKYKYNDSK